MTYINDTSQLMFSTSRNLNLLNANWQFSIFVHNHVKNNDMLQYDV